MTRQPDWERRLQAVLQSWRHKPYAYGTTDCACLAHAAVLAVTGVDLLPDAERPTSWIGAAKFLIARGYVSVEDMVDKLVGPPLHSAALARRGDLVSYAASDERHLAVCVGRYALAPGPDDLMRIPMAAWVNAWKVG